MTATTAPRSKSRRVSTAHRPQAAGAEDGGRCPPYGTTSSTPQPTPSALLAQDFVPIPQETIVRALARLDAIFSDPNASHRDTNAAARTLLAFLKYNQDTLRALIAAEGHEATLPPSEDDDPLDPADAPAPAALTRPDAEDTSEPLGREHVPIPSSLTTHHSPLSTPKLHHSPLSTQEPPKPIPYVNLEVPRDGKPAVMLVAEDPAPDAPAFERYGGLVLFRVGARTNLNGDVRPLYYRLPPGPDRELLKDPSVPIHRRGGGFARLQRFAELGLPPYVAPADTRTRPP